MVAKPLMASFSVEPPPFGGKLLKMVLGGQLSVTGRDAHQGIAHTCRTSCGFVSTASALSRRAVTDSAYRWMCHAVHGMSKAQITQTVVVRWDSTARTFHTSTPEMAKTAPGNIKDAYNKGSKCQP